MLNQPVCYYYGLSNQDNCKVRQGANNSSCAGKEKFDECQNNSTNYAETTCRAQMILVAATGQPWLMNDGTRRLVQAQCTLT